MGNVDYHFRQSNEDIPGNSADMGVTPSLLFDASLPGAAGALVWFIRGIRVGNIRNNEYIRKATLEMLGGSLVASFIAFPLAPLFSTSIPVVIISFAIGTSWASIIQRLRVWITRKLGTLLEDGDK